MLMRIEARVARNVKLADVNVIASETSLDFFRRHRTGVRLRSILFRCRNTLTNTILTTSSVWFDTSALGFMPRLQPRSSMIDFLTGALYVFPGSLISALYETALRTKPTRSEDLFVTGLLAEKLNVTRLRMLDIDIWA